MVALSFLLLTMQRYIKIFYEIQIVKPKTPFVYRLSIIKIFKILIINNIKSYLSIVCLSLDPINIVVFPWSCRRIFTFNVSQDAVSDADIFRVVDSEVT